MGCRVSPFLLVQVFGVVCLAQGLVQQPWKTLLQLAALVLALVVPASLFCFAARYRDPRDFGWWVLVSFGILVFFGVGAVISGLLVAAAICFRLSGV